jgi:hypothetical protein
VHGKGVHALDALGGQVASYRHGWPAVHNRSRGFLLQGKDPLVRDGAGGEVTSREMDGGVLTNTPPIAGNGDILGAGEVAQLALCCVGSARVLGRAMVVDWGSVAVVW